MTYYDENSVPRPDGQRWDEPFATRVEPHWCEICDEEYALNGAMFLHYFGKVHDLESDKKAQKFFHKEVCLGE